MKKQCTNYNIPPELPCCGVATLCHVLDKNFKEVFLSVKDAYSKGEDWYGGMTLHQLLLFLIDNSVEFEELKTKDMTLQEFCSGASGKYVINTPLHFQFFNNGKIYDQKGEVEPQNSEYKNEKIINLIKIF